MRSYASIYNDLIEHSNNSGQSMVSEDEVSRFLSNVNIQRAQNIQAPPAIGTAQEQKAVHDKILKLMIMNQSASKALKNDLPEIHKEKTEYMKKLRAQAALTAKADAKKKEAQQINAKKKAALKELETIRKEREKARLRENGKENVTDKDVEFKVHEEGISSARGRWHILRGAMNCCGLGSRVERRAKAEYPVNPQKEKVEALSFISEDETARYSGAIYTPKNPTGKYALVFTGSHEPGASQIAGIKDAYLAKGVSVIQVDYRGFGKSTNLNKNGEPAPCHPSEAGMYKDGMEMYNFVTKKLGIKPSDLTLHGYSLGGAIASKVAVEATKQMENEARINARKYKPEEGIRSVVLHSPMKSMFYAARNQSFWGGGLLAKWGSGSYDTTAHMKELAKLDKNIPVHLIGGQSDPKKPHYDFLSPKASGLEKELNGKFTKLTSFSGNSDHEGEIWNEAQNKYIIKPNVSIEDNNLSNLLDPAMKREAVRVNENQMQM